MSDEVKSPNTDPKKELNIDKTAVGYKPTEEALTDLAKYATEVTKAHKDKKEVNQEVLAYIKLKGLGTNKKLDELVKKEADRLSKGDTLEIDDRVFSRKEIKQAQTRVRNLEKAGIEVDPDVLFIAMQKSHAIGSRAYEMRKREEALRTLPKDIHSKNKEGILVDVKNITKIYGKNKVLDDVSFSIKEGEKVSIVGSNGSGKTTIAEIIAKVREQDGGHIHYYFGESDSEIKSKIGIQLQDTHYPTGFTVKSIIRFYAKINRYNNEFGKLSDLYKTFLLDGLENQDIRALSFGQKQRLNTIIAILSKPKLLILDEVMNGLDIKSQLTISEFILRYCAENRASLILISHNINEIRLFTDRVIILEYGVKKADIVIKGLDDKQLQDTLVKSIDTNKQESNFANMTTYDKSLARVLKRIDPTPIDINTTQFAKLEEKLKVQNASALFQLEANNFITTTRWIFPAIVSVLILLIFSLFLPMNIVVPGAIALTILGTSLFSFGTTLHDLMHSSLFKRIGTTSLTKSQFLLTITGFNLIVCFLVGLWVTLWGFIFNNYIFANYDYAWIADLALGGNIMWDGIAWFGLLWGIIAASALSLAVTFLFVSITKTSNGFLMFGVVYFLLSIFFGSMFLPRTFIEDNLFSSTISYLLPHRYVTYWICDSFATQSNLADFLFAGTLIFDGNELTFVTKEASVDKLLNNETIANLVFSNETSIILSLTQGEGSWGDIDTWIVVVDDPSGMSNDEQELAEGQIISNVINKVFNVPDSILYKATHVALGSLFVNIETTEFWELINIINPLLGQFGIPEITADQTISEILLNIAGPDAGVTEDGSGKSPYSDVIALGTDGDPDTTDDVSTFYYYIPSNAGIAASGPLAPNDVLAHVLSSFVESLGKDWMDAYAKDNAEFIQWFEVNIVVNTLLINPLDTHSIVLGEGSLVDVYMTTYFLVSSIGDGLLQNISMPDYQALKNEIFEVDVNGDPTVSDEVAYNNLKFNYPVVFAICDTVADRLYNFMHTGYNNMVSGTFNASVWDWNHDNVSRGYIDIPYEIGGSLIIDENWWNIPEGYQNIVDFFVPWVCIVVFNVAGIASFKWAF